mmetsp:Transcript_21106/g.81920  ORF Transcript_21106/g.81920 Transcript_21106/m.81920 type:complete len:238 (-) Transcript_21106:91-804(-)
MLCPTVPVPPLDAATSQGASAEAWQNDIKRHPSAAAAEGPCTCTGVRHLQSLAPSAAVAMADERRRRAADDATRCPVCIATLVGATHLGCGHTYCVSCVTALVERAGALCPMCRRPVTSAAPSYAIRTLVASSGEEPEDALSDADIRELDRQLAELLRGGRGGVGGWLQREWESTQADWRRLMGRLRPPLPAWVVVLVAVLYLLCPIDVISDQAGLIGFLDDAVVLAFATAYTMLFS